MSNDIVRDVYNAGCVTTLYEMYKNERRVVEKMDIDTFADFYTFKSEMNTPPLAVFCWCNTDTKKVCSAYAYHPRECMDVGCSLHKKCIVCRMEGHNAVEFFSGRIATRCTVVHRMHEELLMLKNCWQITDIQLWRFFDTL